MDNKRETDRGSKMDKRTKEPRVRRKFKRENKAGEESLIFDEQKTVGQAV